jgi:hypothetical protein
LNGEFESKVFGINFGVFGSYSRLNTNDWVDFAQSNGDQIAASSSLYNLGLLFKFYYVKRHPNFLDLNIGVAYFNFSGQESFAGHNYDYDFIGNSAGLLGGLGYKRVLSDKFALALGLRGSFVPEGVKYADGEKHDFFGLSLILGIRRIF